VSGKDIRVLSQPIKKPKRHSCPKHGQSISQLQHFELLIWSIEHNYLDLRIAIPLKSDGVPEDPSIQLAPERLFHQKVGIIADSYGDRLAFSSSNNESLGGWYANVEPFHVYLDWEGGRDRERVELERERFERLWANQTPNVAVFTIPDPLRQRLLRYPPKQAPIWQQELEFDNRSIDPIQLPADEVGLGKTIETGLILRYLLVSQTAKRILILAPASV